MIALAIVLLNEGLKVAALPATIIAYVVMGGTTALYQLIRTLNVLFVRQATTIDSLRAIIDSSPSDSGMVVGSSVETRAAHLVSVPPVRQNHAAPRVLLAVKTQGLRGPMPFEVSNAGQIDAHNVTVNSVLHGLEATFANVEPLTPGEPPQRAWLASVRDPLAGQVSTDFRGFLQRGIMRGIEQRHDGKSLGEEVAGKPFEEQYAIMEDRWRQGTYECEVHINYIDPHGARYTTTYVIVCKHMRNEFEPIGLVFRSYGPVST